MDWAEIARLVGQRKLSITADTYSHVRSNGQEVGYATTISDDPVSLSWALPDQPSRLLHMLREVGFEMGRRVYVAPAAKVDVWTAELREPFVAFIALDASERTDEALSDLARSLIDAGCVYSVTWGPQGGRMDLFMDLVTIEKEEACGLEVGGLDVMTVDFHGDPLGEALWYAVYNTSSPEAEIAALVAVVDEEFREQIERYLSDIARLDEDYDVIYDAHVAAEQFARPRGWIERLREKLSARR